jgi:hypothetical protein
MGRVGMSGLSLAGSSTSITMGTSGQPKAAKKASGLTSPTAITPVQQRSKEDYEPISPRSHTVEQELREVEGTRDLVPNQ